MRAIKLLPRLAVLVVCLCAAVPAKAQFPTNSFDDLAIHVAAGDQAVPLAAATPDGRTWITWFDSGGGAYVLRAQLLDVTGNRLLGPDGIVVSDEPQNSALFGYDMMADSGNNLVVAFSDIRAGGDLDIYAYKVSPDGTLAWGELGITISDNANFEPAPAVAEASDGDIVVAWSQDVPSGQDGGVWLQRLAPDGTLRYPAGGIRVFSETNRESGFPDVIAAENGNVIVSWIRDIETFSSPRHIYARKFDANAAGVWPAAVVVYDQSVPIAHSPVLVADGSGGAVFAWHGGLTSNCFVQRLDADGAEVYPHNGVPVAIAAGPWRFDPTIAYDDATGAVMVFWSERDSGQGNRGLFGQRISEATRQWGDGGIEFAAVDSTIESNIRAVPAADGGAIVFYTDEPTGAPNADIGRAMRVDGNGDLLWETGMLEHTSTPSDKFRYSLAVGGCDEVRLVWSDGRDSATNGQDLYARKVNGDATLGPTGPLPGDVNCDCGMDVDDISAFAMALCDPAAYAAAFPGCNPLNADLNEDQTPDGLDIQAFVDLLLSN